VTKLKRRPRPPEKPREEEPDAAHVLLATLQHSAPEDLSSVYEQLKLLGVVIGQIALLDAATSSGDMKAKVSAARALAGLKESPAEIAERLKAGPFAKLSTRDLRGIVEQIKDGRDPRTVLKHIVEQKEQAG